mgnify:CR=1 FL=1
MGDKNILSAESGFYLSELIPKELLTHLMQKTVWYNNLKPYYLAIVYEIKTVPQVYTNLPTEYINLPQIPITKMPTNKEYGLLIQSDKPFKVDLSGITFDKFYKSFYRTDILYNINTKQLYLTNFVKSIVPMVIKILPELKYFKLSPTKPSGCSVIQFENIYRL